MKKICVLLISISLLLGLFSSCKNEDSVEELLSYFWELHLPNYTWNVEQTQTSKAFNTIYEDSLAIQLAAKVIIRNEELDKFRTILKNNNLPTNDLSFITFTPEQTESVTHLLDSLKLDVGRYRRFESEKYTYLEDIKQRNKELVPHIIGWRVNQKVAIANEKNKEKLEYSFLISPKKDFIYKYDNLNSASYKKLHKVLETAINEDY